MPLTLPASLNVHLGSAIDDKAALGAAIRRLDEQIQQAEANTQLLQERRGAYDELNELLEALPEKLVHPVMVPFGPLAFFEGHLQHTNEVLVQLSSEWFATKTAKGACKTVARRQARLRAEEEDVARELQQLQMKRKIAIGESDATGGDRQKSSKSNPSVDIADAPAGTTVNVDEDGFLDIREPLSNPETSHLETGVTPEETSREQKDRPWSDALERLRVLEAQEEEDPRRNELDELDDLLLAYEAEGEGACCSESPEVAVGTNRPGAANTVKHEEEENRKNQEKHHGIEVRSPADLGKMMQRAEEEESSLRLASASLPPASSHSEPMSATPFTGAVLEKEGVTEGIPALVGTGRAKLEESVPTAASAGRPARVSKFKADRQRAAQ